MENLVGVLAQIKDQPDSIIIGFNKNKEQMAGYTVSLSPKKVYFKEVDIVSLIAQNEAEAAEAYAGRVDRRRENIEYKAGQIEAESRRRISTAEKNLATTNGQPIHLDSPNAGKDIRFRNKIETSFIKGYAGLNDAKAIQEKADAVGTGGVSSDDPEAIAKLLAKTEKNQARLNLMKSTNEIVWEPKKFSPTQKVQKLVELGHTPEKATELLGPSFGAEKGGYPTFQYPTAAINNTKKRIASLIVSKCKKLAAENCGPIETYHADLNLRVVENHAISRLQIIFASETGSKRAWKTMKARGFNFSRTEGAYQRKLGCSPWVIENVLSDLRDCKEGV